MFATLKKPALVKIYAIPLVSMIVQSMTGAIAILYALELGADVLQINLITTIRSTMGILLMVPFGILSDRLGRKPMILYSRIIMMLGTLIRAFATDPNHLLLASLAGGFAGGGFWPVLLSMIGDVAKPDERQEAISTFFLFSSFGMLTGPIICSFLLTLQITLRNVYQIVLATQIGIFIYLVFQIRETKPRAPKSAEIRYRLYITGLIRQTSFRGILTMAFFYFFYRSIINTYVPIYAKVDLHLSNAEVASFSVSQNLAIMIIRFSSATFLTRIPIRSFLLSVLALGGITSLASPFANNYLSIVLVLFLSGISYGATAILGNTLVAKISTPKNRGIANSLYNLFQSMGNITKILTSPIADTLGLTPVFILGGITSFIATIPALLRKVDS